jgi:hypothetical protein
MALSNAICVCRAIQAAGSGRSLGVFTACGMTVSRRRRFIARSLFPPSTIFSAADRAFEVKCRSRRLRLRPSTGCTPPQITAVRSAAKHTQISPRTAPPDGWDRGSSWARWASHLTLPRQKYLRTSRKFRATRFGIAFAQRPLRHHKQTIRHRAGYHFFAQHRRNGTPQSSMYLTPLCCWPSRPRATFARGDHGVKQ